QALAFEPVRVIVASPARSAHVAENEERSLLEGVASGPVSAASFLLLKPDTFRHVGSGKALADGELVEGHETPREEQRTGDSSRPKVRLLLALTPGIWIPFRG